MKYEERAGMVEELFFQQIKELSAEALAEKRLNKCMKERRCNFDGCS